MTRTQARILALFHLLPEGKELTTNQVSYIVRTFFGPWPALWKLEQSGYLTSRFVDGAYPRGRVYRMVNPEVKS